MLRGKEEISLSEEQLDEFREAFDIFDEDSSGSLTIDELKRLMEALGQNLTKNELKEILKQSDKSNDGVIDFPEFIFMMMESLNCMDTEEDLLASFKIFDEDGNGNISSSELKKALNLKLPLKEIEEMIKIGDKNEDGEINYEEFVHMIMFSCERKRRL